MPLQDLTADSVRAAIQEFDSLGREAFLRRDGFKTAWESLMVSTGGANEPPAMDRFGHSMLSLRPVLWGLPILSGAGQTIARVACGSESGENYQSGSSVEPLARVRRRRTSAVSR